VASRKWGYAGKFDLICRIGAGPWAGRCALLDNKTSKGVYGETGLQTAAYASAEFMALDDREEPLPPIDCTGVVHVTETGTVFHPLADSPEQIEKHFKIFSHIAYVAKQTDYIGAIVGDPMTVEDEAA
jgi:hypothetical protein